MIDNGPTAHCGRKYPNVCLAIVLKILTRVRALTSLRVCGRARGLRDAGLVGGADEALLTATRGWAAYGGTHNVGFLAGSIARAACFLLFVLGALQRTVVGMGHCDDS